MVRLRTDKLRHCVEDVWPMDQWAYQGATAQPRAGIEDLRWRALAEVGMAKGALEGTAAEWEAELEEAPDDK